MMCTVAYSLPHYSYVISVDYTILIFVWKASVFERVEASHVSWIRQMLQCVRPASLFTAGVSCRTRIESANYEYNCVYEYVSMYNVCCLSQDAFANGLYLELVHVLTTAPELVAPNESAETNRFVESLSELACGAKDSDVDGGDIERRLCEHSASTAHFEETQNSGGNSGATTTAYCNPLALLCASHALWTHCSSRQLGGLMPLVRELLRPQVRNEVQLLYMLHLIGPFLNRINIEKTRSLIDVCILQYIDLDYNNCTNIFFPNEFLIVLMCFFHVSYSE